MITTREILSIGCKIWGLYHLMVGVAVCLQTIPQLAGHGNAPITEFLGQLSIGVFSIIMPLCFLKYSERIAAFLVKEDQVVQVSLGADWQRPLFRICLRVAGVILLVQGIPELIQHLTQYVLFRQKMPAVAIPDWIWGELLSAVVSLALGYYLLRGGSYIDELVKSEPTSST